MFKSLFKAGCVALLALAAVGCSRVDPGYVGVRVSSVGERGVQGELVKPGKLVWNGPGYSLFQFPTFKQNHVYKDADAITFGTFEGLNVTAPIGISYRINEDQATKVFQEYKKGVDEITAVDMRNAVQSAFVNVAGGRKIETVYGNGKAALLEEVTGQVRKQMAASGIQIDQLYWAGNPKLPDAVQGSITNKIRATQMAEQRQNELAQSLAEAEKLRAEAKGQADAKILAAQAEAEAIRIKGDALRQNQELVALTVAEAWDGKLPVQYLGGNGQGTILQLLAK
jgi:regulator of protease activity HflC (stomatin/prohibitin superfamily)